MLWAVAVVGTRTCRAWATAQHVKVLPSTQNTDPDFPHVPRKKEELEIEKNVTKSGNHSGGGAAVPLTLHMGKENYLLTLPYFLIYCFASCSDERTKLPAVMRQPVKHVFAAQSIWLGH